VDIELGKVINGEIIISNADKTLATYPGFEYKKICKCEYKIKRGTH
jgi:hypothetical protein